MSSNINNHSQLHSDGEMYDFQTHHYNMLSPTPVLTEEQQSTSEIVPTKKKCHGNQNLQRFKRKWRARGLTEEQIIARIQKRNHTIPELFQITQTTSKQTHESSKRKRDTESTQNALHSSMKSMSQLSISQEVVCKKVKNSLVGTASSNDEMKDQVNPQEITLYKPSKYLKMPRKLLLHSLHLQLNCSLKKTAVQRFIFTRVRVIDQQFCLEQIRYLYQTYLNLGLQHHVWPVSFPIITLFYLDLTLLHCKNDILQVIQSNELDTIQKYVTNYLLLLQKQIDCCTTELTAQLTTCPSTLYSLEMIDQRLKDFVRLHHIDLSRTINYQVNKLHNHIHINKLSKQLFSFPLTTKQVFPIIKTEIRFIYMPFVTHI